MKFGCRILISLLAAMQKADLPERLTASKFKAENGDVKSDDDGAHDDSVTEDLASLGTSNVLLGIEQGTFSLEHDCCFPDIDSTENDFL